METVIGFSLALFVGGQAAAASGSVAGQVLEQGTNQPIADARVMIMPVAQRATLATFGPPRETIADQAGRYVFDGLEPGNYRITVQKAGYAGLDPFTRPSFVTITAGQTIANANHVLQRGGAIAGRVVDGRGQPIVDAMIMLMREPVSGVMPTRPPGRVRSDASGQFVIPNVTTGTYILSAAAPVANSSAGRTDGTHSAPSGGSISGSAGGAVGTWSV